MVFAVDEEESLEQAESILSYLRSVGVAATNAVILVANKTDLVRSRVVSGSGEWGPDEGNGTRSQKNGKYGIFLISTCS